MNASNHPSLPFRVVLAGCGSISHSWLTHAATRPDLTFVGLVDLDRANAERLRQTFGLDDAHIGTDLVQMIEQTRPDIVFDCTVPSAHTGVTVASLEKGCHVLGEKPMANTMSDAIRMIEAARLSGKTYAVIQNRRYLDGIVRYRNLIQSGAIGTLTTLHADFFLAPHFGGFREEMKHVLLVDMAIHSFDQARFLSGADPLTVYCHEWNPAGSWYAHGASAVCIFEMSNGLVFTYRGSWCAEGLPTAWACAWRAIGMQGTTLWDGEEMIQAERVVGTEGLLRRAEPLTLPPHEPLPYTGHAGVIHEFVESLKNGTTPQTVCTDNVKSLAMVLAAVESAETEQKVRIRYPAG